ncbi:hypothetical protein [Romboutsia ilealis]|uniref:hypothetical protein n=1 Tax=Romboutsia ilealis TaxID=1115758 RepID=UPI00272D2B9B|nr:hypothetical protein [Romboutsia ilealis]
MIMNDEYEILNTIDLDMMLSDLPIDLMKENIRYQVENPLGVGSDYSTIIMDKCNTIIKEYAQVEDVVNEIEQTLDEFYRFIINLLDEKFNLDIDYENMSTKEIIQIGHVLYKFFILRYRKNVSKFIYKFIVKNKKKLAANYTNDDKRKDVVTVVLKKKTKNKDEIRILSNLPLVIKEILSLSHDPEEFMDMCCGNDLYEAEVVKELISDFVISGNFTDRYLSLILDQYNDVLDEIQIEVKIKLMKRIGI